MKFSCEDNSFQLFVVQLCSYFFFLILKYYLSGYEKLSRIFFLQYFICKLACFFEFVKVKFFPAISL